MRREVATVSLLVREYGEAIHFFTDALEGASAPHLSTASSATNVRLAHRMTNVTNQRSTRATELN
jgi:hypothetical protein